MQKSCYSCANLLNSDSAITGLRCGEAYFNQPPIARKMKRMDNYPIKYKDDYCIKYKTRDINNFKSIHAIYK